MEQRVQRLKSCLAHLQRQFGHITAMPMTGELRDSLGELWQYIIHMQLEVAAMERQQQVRHTEAAESAAPQPAVAPHPVQPRPNLSRQGATRLDAGTVLVIDDCQNTQNILSFSLGSEGVHVTSLTEPERWAQTVRNVQPRVILLDLMMPRLDGFEVLRQLRATKDFDSIFVVVGSSRSFEHDRLTVLGMGADDFIPKPYHIKELALKFSNLIRSVRRYS